MNQTSYSQIGQDTFVLSLLNSKRNGLYLDIGAQAPHHINNTYLLEKEFGWHGASIEIDPTCKSQWENSDRDSTQFILQDALTVDYDKLINQLLSKSGVDRIDYLSVDLEPPVTTLQVLSKIPFDKHRFTIITYEHDMYRTEFLAEYDQHYTLRASRALFTNHGYKLLFANTQEDWWVDSTIYGTNSPFIDSNGVHKPYLDITTIPA